MVVRRRTESRAPVSLDALGFRKLPARAFFSSELSLGVSQEPVRVDRVRPKRRGLVSPAWTVR